MPSFVGSAIRTTLRETLANRTTGGPDRDDLDEFLEEFRRTGEVALPFLAATYVARLTLPPPPARVVWIAALAGFLFVVLFREEYGRLPFVGDRQ